MWYRKLENKLDITLAYLFLRICLVTLAGTLINYFAVYTEWSRIFFPNQLLIQISSVITLSLLVDKPNKVID